MNKTTQWIIGGVLGLAGLASGVNFLLDNVPNLTFVVQSFNSPTVNSGLVKRYKVCTNYQCAWSLTNDGKVCDESPLGAKCKPPIVPGNNSLTNVSGSNNSNTNSGTSLFHP